MKISHSISLGTVCLLVINASIRYANADEKLVQGIQVFQSAYDKWDAELFRKADRIFMKSSEQFPSDALPLYWKGAVQFHLVNYYLFGLEELRDKKKAVISIDNALAALEQAVALDTAHAESYALLGTLYGIKIYQKWRFAPVLGPKVFKLINHGLDLEPENPRIQYLIGVSYLFTPKILGGGVSKGLTHLIKAEVFFDKEAKREAAPGEPRWGMSTNLGFIGKAYMKLKETEKAETYFKKALKVNPNDLLAKSGLKEVEKEKGK
ncbi:tetratricopeptide repeat protein [Fibrobacterota bacterium]